MVTCPWHQFRYKSKDAHPFNKHRIATKPEEMEDQVREKEEKPSPQLHTCRVDQPRATIHRVHSLLHSAGILALIYYRLSVLLSPQPLVVTLSWSLIFASELLLSFLWFLSQSFRWRPVIRTAFPDRLPDDRHLPPIDVFICTADPEKEPAVKVMNTVISAMSLDYPAEKLAVYLSDDGGSALTLYALRQAASFAAYWIPYCRKYGVETRCPEAYFCSTPRRSQYHLESENFLVERENIKSIYEAFKNSIEEYKELESNGYKSSRHQIGDDHPPSIEIVQDKGTGMTDKEQTMPMLVYVSREKKPSHPHHFKAGALNVLLRVSGILSNSPYILILGCDMYSNDPTSARQAMCFHLDPHISQSLAYVQFPQNFHTISKNDIYDSQLREIFKIWWTGSDGLSGPPLSGTGFYMKRQALYATTQGCSSRTWLDSTDDLLQLREFLGSSTKLIKSTCNDYKCNVEDGIASNTLLTQEAQTLASCTYEKDTKWGKEIGFLYDSVLEDFVTGFVMHCGGWISVYIDPLRPAFLGTAPMSLNDFLVQNKRWATGLLQVAFSQFCPLTYGLSRKSIFLSMYYGFLAFQPLYSLSVLCYATIPQLCLFNCISLYPKVSNPWFGIFSFIYISSMYQHLFGVFWDGGSIKMWWNEQKTWMMKTASSHFFAVLDVSMNFLGERQVDFELTTKVVDEKQAERYRKGIFDFRGATLMLVPLITLAILNMACFIGGLWRIIVMRSYSEMFGQLFLTFFILIASYPLFEGMIIRMDSGRIPTPITIASAICALLLLSLGSTILILLNSIH